MELLYSDAVNIDDNIFHMRLDHNFLKVMCEGTTIIGIRDDHLIKCKWPKIIAHDTSHLWIDVGDLFVYFNINVGYARMFKCSEGEEYIRLKEAESGSIYTVRKNEDSYILSQHINIVKGDTLYEDTVRDIATHDNDPDVLITTTVEQWEADGSAVTHTTH